MDRFYHKENIIFSGQNYMQMRVKLILSLATMLLSFTCFSQGKNSAPMKFGDITAKDLEKRNYSIDSNAQAIILYDGGSAVYESDKEAWFNVEYTYTRRIHLLNKAAFDLATIEIPLYKSDAKEDRIEKLEAYTYNLENGAVRKTKLDKESLFSDKASKDFKIKKFTLPDLKEGCIIEYRYTIISPRPNYLKSWSFQDRFPVLQSDYEISIPTLFNFVVLKSGYYDLTPILVESNSQQYSLVYREDNYSKAEMFTYSALVTHTKWSLSNLPAMVRENYTTAMRNHMARLEFQLRSINLPGQDPKMIMGNWEDFGKQLLKDEDFGADLSAKNSWLQDDVKRLTVAGNAKETAENIYHFVRDNFSCTDDRAVFAEGSLKKAFTDRKGNVAELNLLLTAMLKKAGITADPVLLSTTDNGHAYELYPLLSKFNYVICKAVINDKDVLLDASKKKLGYDRLPEELYNGYGRVITESPYVVSLFPDSLKEVKRTTIYINNTDGGKMTGYVKSDLGDFGSYDLREKLAGSSKEDYFKKIKSTYTYDITMMDMDIDSLDKYDEKISVRYGFSFEPEGDIIYFNPLLTEGYKTNPFKAAARNYPVEMPYTTDELIVLSIDIPKGYKVDELPKSARVNLNGEDGMFEYLTQADAGMIQMRCRLRINKAYFEPGDYATLRDFFAYVVKKQSEQIVFKKK